MRLLVLGEAPNIHVVRWTRWFAERGHDVHIASLETDPGLPGGFHALPRRAVPRALRYPLAAPALRRLLATLEPDVVNAHFVPNYGVLAALAGASPLALTVWGSDVFLSARRSPLHAARARWALRAADLVLSDAAALTDAISALGVPRERVLTVPLGVDTRLFTRARHPPAGAADAAAARPEREPLVASTRRLETLYDVGTLLEAARLVSSRRPIRVEIAGDGAERARLAASADARALGTRLRFRGALSEREIADLLARADVYVSTSLSDSTSVSLLEAMASGAFPVVSDLPANREWITHGETGLIFAPRDHEALAVALEEALAHRALRARAGERNREVILARASRGACMERVERAFADLAARHRRSVC